MLETYEIIGWLVLGFCSGIGMCAVLCEAHYGATPPDADHDPARWTA